ncbi:hypothetical protein [Lysobacter gummosus]|uniref:hypothetical protein n=1 Tax=Lysobacter gummosus TaxID=262324 RepID=UPI000AD0C368
MRCEPLTAATAQQPLAPEFVARPPPRWRAASQHRYSPSPWSVRRPWRRAPPTPRARVFRQPE